MTENEVASTGGKVAPRLAKVLSDAIVYTTQRLTDHKSSFVQKQLADFTNHVSDEVQQMFGGIFRTFAEHPETPDELKPLFSDLANGRGQAIAWLGGSIAGTAASASLFDLINNLLAPVVHRLIAEVPNAILSPDIAAAAAVRELAPGNQDEFLFIDYAGNGIDFPRWRILQELARTRASVNQTQQLVNLGHWDFKEGAENLVKGGYKYNDAVRLLEAKRMLLSPPEYAAMQQRDIVSTEEAIKGGQLNGMTEEDVKRLIELAGEPLGPQALGEAFRRGFIDRARFQRGIVQGPLRKEWFDVLELLQFSRMSTVDAADAVNQGHMDLTEAQKVASANGLDPNDFATLIQIAGAPPGVDFITEALNRGFIDETAFTSAFLESRIKNKYVPLFLQMRTRLIPQETVRLLYRNGVYSHDAALQTLRWHGFSQTDAEALLNLENTRQDGATKELTRAQIVDLYEVRAIDVETTVQLLLSLGYSEDNARAMIELADLRRLQKFIDSAVNRVKGAFLAGRIEAGQASAQLDQLGIPPDQRDDYLTIWGIDRSTVSKQLSPAQIRQAVKKSLIDEAGALARLTAQGYDAEDAAIFLQLTA